MQTACDAAEREYGGPQPQSSCASWQLQGGFRHVYHMFRQLLRKSHQLTGPGTRAFITGLPLRSPLSVPAGLVCISTCAPAVPNRTSRSLFTPTNSSGAHRLLTLRVPRDDSCGSVPGSSIFPAKRDTCHRSGRISGSVLRQSSSASASAVCTRPAATGAFACVSPLCHAFIFLVFQYASKPLCHKLWHSQFRGSEG